VRGDEGREIAGFRIESEIGRGGMGVVYLAHQTYPERKVALKLLSPDLASDPAFRERFVHESNAAASTEHPNIVPVYGAGQADGALFIAMRYVEGTDLRTLLAEQGPLPPKRGVHICAQIADALDAAHERGLVHRDVKPANILVGKSDHAYLSDFGLIRRSEVSAAITKTGQFMGTIDYASPEQFEGKPLGPPTDVYSLGCVVFECLVGEPPFRREQDAAVMYAHLHDPPPSATARRPEVPGGVDQVIGKAMAKRPVDRYATAGELAAALRDAVVGERPPEPRQIRPSKRGWLAVAGVLVAVGVALAIVALARGGDDPESAARSPAAAGSALPAGSLAKIDAETGEAALVIPDVAGLTRDADIRPNLAIGEGGVWMSVSSNPAYALLQHFDEGTGEVRARHTIPAAAHALAVGSRTVWFSHFGTSSVSRINPASYESLEPVSIESGLVTDIVLGGGRLWVGSSDGTLTAFDPLTGRRLDEIETQGTPDALAYGSGSVWALDLLASEVIRIDPSRPKRVGKIPIPGNLKDIAAGEGGVWVFDAAAGTATEIDPLTEAPGPPVGVGPAPSSIVVGLGSAWVSDGEDGNLYRIDPELRRATPIPLGAPLAIVAIDDAGRSVWVGAFSTGEQL
jgi:streptogramin lyase/predicted Ser/Thr protein kinase